MRPTPNQVHVNRPLTNQSVAFIQNHSHFIAAKVFPLVPVEKKSDDYFIYPKGCWFRDEALERGPGTETAGGDYDIDVGSYSCKPVGYHKDVTDDERANSDSPLNPDTDATEFVTQKLLIRRERHWTKNYFKSGVWGSDMIGGTDFAPWDDEASNPVRDVRLARTAILGRTGFIPNTLVIGANVFDHLSEHPMIVDRVKYTSAEVVTEDVLARLFRVNQVLVAQSVFNAGAEGGEDDFKFIHGNHAGLYYVESKPSIRKPSAGYIYAWKKGGKSSTGETVQVKKFRMEHLASDRIEAEESHDYKVVASDLGHFWENVVS